MCWYRKHAPQCEVLQIRERTNGCISVLLKQLPSMNSVICSSTTHLDQIDQFPFWALRHGLILINHLAGVSRDSSVDLCPSAMCLLKHIDYWWTFLRGFFFFFLKLINLQSIAAKRWLKLSRGNLKKNKKKHVMQISLSTVSNSQKDKQEGTIAYSCYNICNGRK